MPEALTLAQLLEDCKTRRFVFVDYTKSGKKRGSHGRAVHDVGPGRVAMSVRSPVFEQAEQYEARRRQRRRRKTARCDSQ